MDGLYYTVKIA